VQLIVFVLQQLVSEKKPYIPCRSPSLMDLRDSQTRASSSLTLTRSSNPNFLIDFFFCCFWFVMWRWWWDCGFNLNIIMVESGEVIFILLLHSIS
jgi:hypothetical protein